MAPNEPDRILGRLRRAAGLQWPLDAANAGLSLGTIAVVRRATPLSIYLEIQVEDSSMF